MKGKRERFRVTFTIEVLLMMWLIVLTGCKTKQNPPHRLKPNRRLLAQIKEMIWVRF